LTITTGTGKTFVAFLICWKLWESGWNAWAEKRRPRIYYLADRNILIPDESITGDVLIAFINQDRATLPDGREGQGLFAYLRSLTGSNGGDRL
jgi:type I site-specific restriction endonuclease